MFDFWDRAGTIFKESFRSEVHDKESNRMLTLTDKAQGKVKEILDSQPEPFAGLRVQVVGGGCSGFQYHMGFEKQENSGDEVLEMGGFKVFVDA